MTRSFGILAVIAFAELFRTHAVAQELGPGFTKIQEGIYVFAPDATTTTCASVVTQDGVVMIDSCNSL